MVALKTPLFLWTGIHTRTSSEDVESDELWIVDVLFGVQFPGAQCHMACKSMMANVA